jgi:hypothetical protein|tara:strand:- start:58 stop:261 length:204 start_codon:yes stop_codon:yes gene_type:complete
MTKEITANGSTAVITTDSPMEQTIVIEPEPLSSVSFAGIEVQTGDLWFGLIVVVILVGLHKYLTSKR